MSVNHTIELGFLQMQVLWMLSKQPVHGYKLMEMLSRVKRTRVTQGTLYPTLARLESMGMIRAVADGPRKRRVFHLTAAGRRAADASCREFITIYQSIFYDYFCMACKGHDEAIARPIVINPPKGG